MGLRARSMQQHTEAILSRIGAFGELARVAGRAPRAARRRRLPARAAAPSISLETRIITMADIFDAISADRPYRPAVPVPQTLDIMAQSVGTAIDALCFEALKQVVAGPRQR